MKSICSIILPVIFCFSHLSAQRSNKGIDIVRMDVINNKLLIQYDLINSENGDNHNIYLRFITEDQELIIPYHLIGDEGNNIAPGNGKIIEWDVASDMNVMNYQLSPLIISDLGMSSRKIGGGQGYAMLSIFLPGLGDYFVADRKDMKFKPAYRMILGGGCIALGTYAAMNRTRGEDKYALSLNQVGRWWSNPDYEPTYSKQFYGYGEMEYALFKGDAEILLATGFAVWLYDIIWVYAQGNLNKKLRSSMKSNPVSMKTVPGGVGLAYTRRF